MPRVIKKKAIQFLKGGGVVALPTETVYGLAANALDKDAVHQIFELKGRPADNPLIVHVAHMRQVEELTSSIDGLSMRLMNTFWPGPMTLILPKSESVPLITTGGLDTIALRMPSHGKMRKILKRSNLPLAAPSANPSGKPSATHHRMVKSYFPALPFVRGGWSKHGLESTVLRSTGDAIEILRPGALRKEQILEAFPGTEVRSVEKSASSPGTRYKHYAPSAPLNLIPAAEWANLEIESDAGYIALQEHLPKARYTYNLGRSANQAETRIYAALRYFDNHPVRAIYIRDMSKEGGEALNERIRRASEV
jgi:L-threonylcarbamoyladenylate synthase